MKYGERRKGQEIKFKFIIEKSTSENLLLLHLQFSFPKPTLSEAWLRSRRLKQLCRMLPNRLSGPSPSQFLQHFVVCRPLPI